MMLLYDWICQQALLHWFCDVRSNVRLSLTGALSSNVQVGFLISFILLNFELDRDMEGFCFKQQQFKLVKLWLTFFFLYCQSMTFLVVFMSSLHVCLILGALSLTFKYMGVTHPPVSHSSVHLHCQSSLCVCVCARACVHQSMIQFAFLHIQFPTLFYLLFKKKKS